MRALFAIVAVVTSASPSPLACGRETLPSPPALPATTASSAPDASPPPTASATPPPPWTAPDTGDRPPTDEVLRQACGPIVKVFEDSGLRDPDEARKLLDAMKKNPPPLPSEQLAWCSAQISASIDAAAAAALTAEAKNNLGLIATAMLAAYDRETVSGHAVVRRLCASARPVPKTLPAPGTKYASKPEDWRGDAGWSCLKFGIDAPQAYQYEVKTTGNKGFVAYARRADGKEIEELSLAGKINATTALLEIDGAITTRRVRASSAKP